MTTTTEEAPAEDESASATLEALEELVDDFLDGRDDNKKGAFLVALRLSPHPESLVKGYDFKMLNKYG